MIKPILVLALPLLALAWWDVGHLLTSAIAEIRLNQLDPFASVRFRELVNSINDLVDERSRTFIESACWPDDIKGSTYNMGLWNPWHYKDGPYVMDTVVPQINYTEGSVNSINVVGIARNVLKINVLNNTAERALFARYLVHLVGDIHQPLHSVALYNKTYPKGDAGGNLISVVLINGSKSNFHSYWDAGGYRIQNNSFVMKRPLNMQNLTVLKDIANGMISQYGNQIEGLGTIIDPFVWAQESYRIALNTTYPKMETSNSADQAYTRLTYETSRKRITLAGYRLANFVIDIYKNATRSEEIDPIALWKAFAQDSIEAQQIKAMAIKQLQTQEAQI